MERLPHLMSVTKPSVPTTSPALGSPTSQLPVSTITSSSAGPLRQLTANDKAISVPPHPHFRFPSSDPYPSGVSPYMHSINNQEVYPMAATSSSPVSSPLPPVLLQREQNSLIRNNFNQREIIPSSITETIHHTSSLPPESVVKEVTPTNITNITNGSSVPELLNNNDVVSITSAQAENTPDGEGNTSSALNVIPPKSGQSYVDITEYLNMPQSDAAKKLGVPTSTLSKRWKEAVRGRKWPYRMVCKLDKEIMTLLHNIPQGPGAPPLPEEVEATLGLLIRKRSEELKSVVIRI